MFCNMICELIRTTNYVSILKPNVKLLVITTVSVEERECIGKRN